MLAGVNDGGEGGTQLAEASAGLVDYLVELAVVSFLVGGCLDHSAPS